MNDQERVPAGYVRCMTCGKWWGVLFRGGTQDRLYSIFSHQSGCTDNYFQVVSEIASPGRKVVVLWSGLCSEYLGNKEFQNRCNRITELMARREILRNQPHNVQGFPGSGRELACLEVLGVECGVVVSWRRHSKSKHRLRRRTPGTVFDVTSWNVTIAWGKGAMATVGFDEIQILSEKERREAMKRSQSQADVRT